MLNENGQSCDYLSSMILAALAAISLKRFRFHANCELNTRAARPELSENSASKKLAVAGTWLLSFVLRIARAILAKAFISALVYDSGGGREFCGRFGRGSRSCAGSDRPVRIRVRYYDWLLLVGLFVDFLRE